MRLFYCFLALLFVVCLPFNAMAQSSVAVVDVRYILGQSDAGKSIHQQRSEIHSKFLAEISKTEQDLREQEQVLLKERETLSSDVFLKKKQEYERNFLETGRLARKKKQALDTMFAEAVDRLKGTLTDIVKAIASERGYNLVLTKQNVIIGAESIDITKEAMMRLNKALPEIKLKKQ